MRLLQAFALKSMCIFVGSAYTFIASSPILLVATSASTTVSDPSGGAPTAGPDTSRWIWSVPGDWICRHDADCSGPPWPGTSIRFRSTIASDSNGRKEKDRGRRIVDHKDGVTPIYGYVRGKYAQGCKVTKVGGADVLIEEWEYGADVWDVHRLRHNGETFTVNLKRPQNAVQILSNDYAPFAVTISQCSLASYALDAPQKRKKISMRQAGTPPNSGR